MCVRESVCTRDRESERDIAKKKIERSHLHITSKITSHP